MIVKYVFNSSTGYTLSQSNMTTTFISRLTWDDPPDIAVPAPIPTPRPTLPGDMRLVLPS